MFDETTFQTCVRAVQDLVFLKTGTDISVELQSVFKLDETLNDLRKLVKEGNGTGRVVEMISDIVSAIVNGYVSRELKQWTFSGRRRLRPEVNS